MNNFIRHFLLVCGFFYSYKGFTQDYVGKLPDFQDNQIYSEQSKWLLKLNVNGHVSEEVYSFKKKGDDFWGDADILRSHNIHVDPALKGYINIGKLAKVTAHYDNASQTLDVTVPSAWLPLQQLQLNDAHMANAHRDTGLLLDYDLYTYHPAGQAAYGSAYVTTSLFSDKFYLINAGTWFQDFNGNSGYYSRINTTFSMDNEAKLTTFQAGDIVTRPVADENSVRLGGVKFSRDYSLDRNFITYPTMKVTGTASVPNKIDVFVNNSKVANTSVDSGPFVVSNIPFINGDGTAQIVTTDGNGRQVSSTISFYNSSELLKEGLSDYDLDLGLLRYSRYRQNDRYQHLASSLSYRYGLTDYLTTALHGEAADRLQGIGMANNLKIGKLGVVSGSLYHSNTGYESGNRYSVGYSYNNSRGAINISRQQSDSQYHSLADYGSHFQHANSTDQINISGYLGQLSLGAGFFTIKSGGEASRVVNLSTSLATSTSGSFSFAVSHDLTGGGNSAWLSWTLFFGDGYSMRAGANSNPQSASQDLTLSKTITGETGVGGSVGVQHQYYLASENSSASNNDSFNGSLNWKHRYGETQGGIRHPQPRQEDYWLESSGSLIMMDNSIFATRNVNDSFLLIDANGLGNISYEVEGRAQDQTNDRGISLVPDVSSYTNNRIVIKPENVPANVDIERMEQTVNVKRGGGRVVHLALSKASNTTLHIKDKSGQPVSAGLLISGLPDEDNLITGYDGVAYLPHLDKTRTLSIKGEGVSCHIVVNPANIDPVTRQMPAVTCQ